MSVAPFISFNPIADSVTVGPNLNLASSNANAGTTTPVWTSVSGVTVAPGVVHLQWMRLGNSVLCGFATGTLSTSAGLFAASITLPFPMSVPPSGGPLDPMGSAAFLGDVSHPSTAVLISSAGSNPNVAGLNALNIPAMVGTLLSGTFTYRIAA
jgi:hypothetical protein